MEQLQKVLSAKDDGAIENDEIGTGGSNDTDFEFSKVIVLKEKTIFMVVWNQFDIICCVLSSYVYGFAAAFQMTTHVMEPDYNVMLLDTGFFIVFSISMIFKFIKEYTPQGEQDPCRDLSMISARYLKGSFLTDLIPLIPLHWIINFRLHRWCNILFLVKVMRIWKGLHVFDVRTIMEKV